MEFLGQTQTATYLTGPHLQTQFPHLSSNGSMQNTYKSYDSYTTPFTLRRSITMLPWRPSSYYQSAKLRNNIELMEQFLSGCFNVTFNVGGHMAAENNVYVPNQLTRMRTMQRLQQLIADWSCQASPAIALTRSMPEPVSQRTQLTELDAWRVPPFFNSARNALYTRFTPNDWMASNQSNYLASDYVRNGAERLRLDTVRLCREADDKTKRTQGDVGKRLGERLQDINFWKNELNNETDNMVSETNQLQETKRMLEKYLVETENPLHIVQECLYNREKRQSVDLVHDRPEKELIKELDLIRRCQNRMRNTIDKANLQLSLNRAAQHEVEKDSNDKFMAQNLDNVCHGLRNTSRGIAYHNSVHRIDNTISVPETWAKHSNDNIQRSQSERVASKNMRHEIESVINACNNEMWQEWNAVNEALNGRVKESTDARNKIQTHLYKVLQEVFGMEKNIELLKKAIQDKVAPMQVAQTRLDTRLRRPNVELCRDPVQHRLVEEVGEITETVDSLEHRLREAENALQALLRTKAALEQDLSIKNNSLFIDREKCLAMRKTFPMAAHTVSL